MSFYIKMNIRNYCYSLVKGLSFMVPRNDDLACNVKNKVTSSIFHLTSSIPKALYYS